MISAMICELNPLHNGHLHVIGQMKKDEPDAVCLLVMSGNLTQRAGSALFDKYARARAAVESGADLVVELPFPYCSAGAENFARAGVQIAESLGAGRLYFGSECGDIEALGKIARVSAEAEYAAVFSALTAADPSLGAAAAKDAALARLIPDHIPGKRPNDTLAAEYLRFATVPCVAVKRIETPSASDIRKMSREEASAFVPKATVSMMERERRSDAAALRRLLWEYLRLNRGDTDGVAECGGGLGERLLRLSRRATSGEEFFSLAATKKYTNSRILRAALFAALGVRAKDISSDVRFTVLLAASERGRRALALRRGSGDLPVITKPADIGAVSGDAAFRRASELSARADELYTLTIDPALPADEYLRRSPFMM